MENKNKKAKMVYKLYSKYSEAITSILVVNCVCSVMVSSLTTYYFSNVYGDGSVTIVTIILTLIVLIFTEITPKILGREYSEVVAMRLALVLKTIMFILTPINKIISKFERKVKNKHKVTATKDELVEIVKTIKDEGVIEEKESAFIQKAVILKRLRVQNIMISKENVSYLYDTDSSFKVRKCIFRDHHDRIPIITKDNKIVTPKSDSILPSITRRSLMVVAKEYLGLEVEEREVYFDEVKDFAECGLCGTAAVISPVGKIVDHGKEICFPSGMNEMGPVTKKLYDTLTGIQMGHIKAPEGWVVEIK